MGLRWPHKRRMLYEFITKLDYASGLKTQQQGEYGIQDLVDTWFCSQERKERKLLTLCDIPGLKNFVLNCARKKD